MSSNLFFYLFYNIHNGVLLKRIKYNWLRGGYTISGDKYYMNRIENIFFPVSISDFARNSTYFFEFSGFNKEVDLFRSSNHPFEDSLYSLSLEFLIMAFFKKTQSEIFSEDYSYDDMFSEIAIKYANQVKACRLESIEREKNMKKIGIISKSNFGDTNLSLGNFTNLILKRIQEKYILEAYHYKDYKEIFNYFSKHFENEIIIKQELLIAKQMVESGNISTENYFKVSETGFKLNRKTSSLINTLIKLKK